MRKWVLLGVFLTGCGTECKHQEAIGVIDRREAEVMNCPDLRYRSEVIGELGIVKDRLLRECVR